MGRQVSLVVVQVPGDAGRAPLTAEEKVKLDPQLLPNLFPWLNSTCDTSPHTVEEGVALATPVMLTRHEQLHVEG